MALLQDKTSLAEAPTCVRMVGMQNGNLPALLPLLGMSVKVDLQIAVG